MSSFSTHVYETPIYANLKVYPKRNIKKHKHTNTKITKIKNLILVILQWITQYVLQCKIEFG